MLDHEANGFESWVQATRIIVTREGDSRTHVLLNSASETWGPPDLAKAKRIFPVEIVSTIVERSEGMIMLDCEETSDRKALVSAAAAGTVLCASWAWDESDSFVVRFRNSDVEYELSPRLSNGKWIVETST